MIVIYYIGVNRILLIIYVNGDQVLIVINHLLYFPVLFEILQTVVKWLLLNIIELNLKHKRLVLSHSANNHGLLRL